MTIAVPYIDRIWRAEGAVTIDEPLTPEEAFGRLDPLFQTPGTTRMVAGDTLTYAKRNPGAQDKLATFTSGTLRLEPIGTTGARLSFRVSSTALLLCFLAPLLFLGFAQGMTQLNTWEREKAAAEAAQGTKKDEDKPKVKRELHPIDKLLGAPEPEDPAKKKKDEDKPKEKLKTTPAYVLAGLFFVIYLVGRVLEPWLLKRTLRSALSARRDESAAGYDAATAIDGPRPEAC